MRANMKGPQSVDEYLLYLPDDKRLALERVRAAIKKAAPKAEEYIGYGMPGYKYKGSLVYFGAFKNHCSFFPGGKHIAKVFEKELLGFKTNAGTIQFTIDKPLPITLIQKIVKVRVKENEENEMLKNKKKSGY